MSGTATMPETSDQPALEVQDLRKAYGTRVALEGLSLAVAAGETIGLLGPNGAGKSTTMHLMAGVLSPDAGQIRVAGSTDPRRPVVRRNIGIAPQSLALYPDLTAEENLVFFGRLAGLRSSLLAEQVERSLALAGLVSRRAKRVSTFSGGMKRRLNIACAAVHAPVLLLLDEPTVGVDPQSRNHIFESIETLRDRGMTVVYSTHYMEEAERLCDRVAVVDHGRLLALDTVEELTRRHGGEAVVEVELASVPADGSTIPGWTGGTSLRLAAPDPFEAIASLHHRGLNIRSLRVESPNLERVFLNLTGRRLRDE